MANGLTAAEFIDKWRAVTLNERAVSQSHFNDLCSLLGEPTPIEADPEGEWYCFERGARKDSGGGGWADVWKRGHFAWEYKTQGKDLDAAFQQLRQYALALENPPLLIVSDTRRFRIHTNWTNSVSTVHEFTLYELDDPGTRNLLKWAFSDPERLRPEQTRQALTEQAAATFAELAQGLREKGEDPQTVAHFVNRLVFCMFAEDVGLLPDQMFRRMLDQARLRPDQFAQLARSLFAAMQHGGMVGFEEVAWFNGGLFDDDTTLPLDRPQVNAVREAAGLDWSEIDPSILGTLFERGLNPDKRSQLGAHYTDRDKIMQIVEPVIVRPWLADWAATKERLSAELEQASKATTSQAASRRRQRSSKQLRDFLERLAGFRVLDPACGSGNFLYLALHALKDLEHRVRVEAQTLGLQPPFPAVCPANVKGIELNPYAAELARVSVWIGEIQWMRRHGFREDRDPILKPLDTIECRDAVLTARRAGTGVAGGGCGDWESAVSGWEVAYQGVGRELHQGFAAKLYGDFGYTGDADLVCLLVRQGRNSLVTDGKVASRRSGRLRTRSEAGAIAPCWIGSSSGERHLRRLVGRAVGGGRRGRAGLAHQLCIGAKDAGLACAT